MKTIFNPDFALPLLLLGITLRYLIARRRFNRRGLGGLQHFPAYWLGLLTTLIEWLLSWIAFAMICAGLILLIK